MESSKIVLYVVLSLVLIVALSFFFNSLGIINLRIFGTAEQDAKYDVQTESRVYIESKTRDLANYQFEYNDTDDEVEKKAILRRMLGDFSNFDVDKLEDENLKQFLLDAKNGRL